MTKPQTTSKTQNILTSNDHATHRCYSENANGEYEIPKGSYRKDENGDLVVLGSFDDENHDHTEHEQLGEGEEQLELLSPENSEHNSTEISTDPDDASSSLEQIQEDNHLSKSNSSKKNKNGMKKKNGKKKKKIISPKKIATNKLIQLKNSNADIKKILIWFSTEKRHELVGYDTFKEFVEAETDMTIDVAKKEIAAAKVSMRLFGNEHLGTYSNASMHEFSKHDTDIQDKALELIKEELKTDSPLRDQLTSPVVQDACKKSYQLLGLKEKVKTKKEADNTDKTKSKLKQFTENYKELVASDCQKVDKILTMALIKTLNKNSLPKAIKLIKKACKKEDS